MWHHLNARVLLSEWFKSLTIDESLMVQIYYIYIFQQLFSFEKTKRRQDVDARYHRPCSKHPFRSG